jgi:hypothetical protein
LTGACHPSQRVCYPERFAHQASGHNSKAVHHACPKRADLSRRSLGACCPNRMERGSATRSSPECRTDAGNSMGFRTVERAAAHRAALRRRRNDSGNTPLGEGGSHRAIAG